MRRNAAIRFRSHLAIVTASSAVAPGSAGDRPYGRSYGMLRPSCGSSRDRGRVRFARPHVWSVFALNAWVMNCPELVRNPIKGAWKQGGIEVNGPGMAAPPMLISRACARGWRGGPPGKSFSRKLHRIPSGGLLWHHWPCHSSDSASCPPPGPLKPTLTILALIALTFTYPEGRSGTSSATGRLNGSVLRSIATTKASFGSAASSRFAASRRGSARRLRKRWQCASLGPKRCYLTSGCNRHRGYVNELLGVRKGHAGLSGAGGFLG